MVFLCGLVCIACAAGCSDKSRRMSEREALQYRFQQGRKFQRELTQEQLMRLGQSPARTQGEIDALVDTLRHEARAMRERERTAFLESRRWAREGMSPLGTPRSEGTRPLGGSQAPGVPPVDAPPVEEPRAGADGEARVEADS